MISLLLVIVALATLLTACGSFKCDLCGKESDGEKHEKDDAVLCDDCYNSLNDLNNAIDSLNDSIDALNDLGG